MKLIETLRYEMGSYTRLELHLQRLEAGARALGFPFDRGRVLAVLADSGGGMLPLRVRLTLDENGQIETQSNKLTPTAAWRYVVSGKTVDSNDVLRRFKTDWRDLYDAEREQAARAFSCDEVVFCNERGEVCEGSRSNLFVSVGGQLLTPAESSGLLSGCLRKELLLTGRCREAVLRLADLAEGNQVFFGNSLRGLVPALPADVQSSSTISLGGNILAESRPLSA